MEAAMTATEIDKSSLPSVQDVCQCFSVLEDGALAHSLQEQEIEHFYSCNVQKSQVVQNDLRLARRLQEEEEQRAQQRAHVCHRLRQLEEQDCEYAQRMQEEIQRRAEEAQKREAEDEEMAKRLQEEEEMEIKQQMDDLGCLGDASDLRQEASVCVSAGLLRQLQQDAELARRLQAEEEEGNEPRPQREGAQSHGLRLDFRAAQIAQDEEIACYMQRQERKTSRRASDLDSQGGSGERDQRDGRETNRKKAGALQLQRERLNSEGLHSPLDEDYFLDNHPPSPALPTPQIIQPLHNIAEELDPTFKGRKMESQLLGNTDSGVCLAPRSPHTIFYDYLPEPAFIPPTKRQSDKSARPKTKEKKEACKQQ